jgi:uncharacterized membrane protein YdjX (TVP38/TMEM64 family)
MPRAEKEGERPVVPGFLSPVFPVLLVNVYAALVISSRLTPVVVAACHSVPLRVS